ncbi:uncharacterized protein ATC70_002203 [Mucor velutinosus]|uniref:BZIP domain-containing protein n=1 Tax=Mucor velutinosus TaxID=708070 RepID=A0AAN7DDM7_9FUNG|nr:hypothetical protein ATC70_002203 [Mucor velutinosus]
MDQIDLNTWLNGDDDIMDTLVGLASIPDESASSHRNPQNSGADILEFILQTGNIHNSNPASLPISTQHTQPHPPAPAAPSTASAPSSTSPLQQANQMIERQSQAPNPIVISDAMFRDSVSVVQEKDNFVTFLPHSTPATKKQTAPKKAKFKEPIFVTESPQSYKKKKRAAAAANPTNHSSAEDNSDDDMLLEDDMHHSNSSLKQMTSKERRQLRNKISARNFRVRRKEYITQLEEKVSDHEKTIKDLKKENEKLRQANQELMKQLLIQPITPPSSSGDELLSSSSTSSGSEGHHSPDAVPPAYHFQLNDLYDFNLFDQQAQQAAHQQTQMNESSNLFYLNHATMPDWDMTQVLSDKGKSISPEDYQRELSRELINDYPLLAPALMSIVLRHTLSLEYVTALAKEFSDKVGADLIGEDPTKTKHTEDDQETIGGLDLEDLKASFNTLKIEDKQESTEKKPELSELDITKIVLTKHYRYYVMNRARGLTHEEIIEKCKPCVLGEVVCSSPMTRLKKKLVDQGRKKESSGSKGNNIQTLHAYCRVAGNLLRHPHRMTRVSDVLRKEIEFTENKHAAQVESHYRSLISPSQKPRIAS